MEIKNNSAKKIRQNALWLIRNDIKSAMEYRKKGMASLAYSEASKIAGQIALASFCGLLTQDERNELSHEQVEITLGIFYDLKKERERARDERKARKTGAKAPAV